jgi:hypothetical protein
VLDHRVGRDLHAGVDARAAADGGAREAQTIGDALVQLRLGSGELGAVVDADQRREPGGGGGDHAARARCLGHHVGEVELTLGVVSGEAGHRFAHEGHRDQVDAGVDLGDVPLGLAGVAVLADACDPPLLAAKDAAIPGGIGGVAGEHGHRRALGARVRGAQGVELGGLEQGRVAAEHEAQLGALPQLGQRASHRVAGALLLGLHRGAHAVPERGAQPGLHLGAAVADDDDHVLRARVDGRLHHVLHHGATAELVGDLGPRALHARALSSGEDDGGEHGGVRYHSPIAARQQRSRR